MVLLVIFKEILRNTMLCQRVYRKVFSVFLIQIKNDLYLQNWNIVLRLDR